MNPFTLLVDGLASGLEALADIFVFVGGHQWALAILVFTVLLKSVLLPLKIKQTKASLAMSRLKPELDRIKKKYGNDRERMARENQELFRREGVSPLGCAGPMIIQMPILFAMYRVMLDLSKVHTEMPFLGLGNLADNTGTSFAGWTLLALMTVSSIISARQISGDNQQQKMMAYMMPLFFVLIMINLPAGVVLYWTASNLYDMVQQRIMLSRAPETKELAKVASSREAAKPAAKDTTDRKSAPKRDSGSITTPSGRAAVNSNKRNRKRKS